MKIAPSRNSLLALLGMALATTSAVACAMTMVWFSAFPYTLAATPFALSIALVAALMLAGICLYHWFGWLNEERFSRVSVMSWRLHWASYAIAIVAILAMGLTLSVLEVGSLGFWLMVVAALTALLAQSVGAVQYVRRHPEPGTLGVHLRNWIARRNARADAQN